MMDWEKIWAFNKKVIDPIAPRYTALEKGSAVPVFISGVTESVVDAQKHPKVSHQETNLSVTMTFDCPTATVTSWQLLVAP